MAYPHKSGGFRDKKRGGFGGGRPGFGGGRPSFGRDRNDGPREMFRATCASCQKPCEVPFRPTGDKPVYCSDCFSTQRGGGEDRGGRRDDRGGRDRFSKREFTPSFAPKPATEDKRIDTLKRQLDVLSVKVDQILAIVSNRPKVPVEVAKKPKKEIDEAGIAQSLKNMIADVQKSDVVKTVKQAAKKAEKKGKKIMKNVQKKVVKKKVALKKK